MAAEFLREYFGVYKYQSITTSDFIDFFKQKFPKTADRVDFEKWLRGTGGCPELGTLDTSLVEEAATLAKEWLDLFKELKYESVEDGTKKLSGKFSGEVFNEWDPKQKLCFLNELKANITEVNTETSDVTWDEGCVELLQQQYDLDSTRNSEIRFVWYRLALLGGYGKIIEKVKEFLSEQGRMKFVRPLFNDLYHTFPRGDFATMLFKELKGRYHSICVKMVERDLGTEQ